MRRNPDRKHITRMNYSGNGRSVMLGWWVRFWRKDPEDGKIKIVAHKFFPDKRYGDDKDKSFQAARKWRDKKSRELCMDRPFKIIPREDNKSGIPGVFYSEVMIKTRKIVTQEWVAAWTENGVQKRRTFSIKKWGYNGAFKKAVDARHEAERRIFDDIQRRYENKFLGKY